MDCVNDEPNTKGMSDENGDLFKENQVHGWLLTIVSADSLIHL